MTVQAYRFHTYCRYRTYITSFVAWLGKTAHHTGQVGNFFGDASTAKKAKKKSKSKTQAKGNSGKTHEIHFDDFVSLAQAVASADGVEVPKYVIWALRVLIYHHIAYESYGLIHEEPADSDAETIIEDDSTTLLAVSDVLKRVLNLLEPMSKYADVTEPDYNADRVASITEILEQSLKDQTDAGVSQWVPEHIAKVAASKKPDLYVISRKCCGPRFASYCFLYDLLRLRLHVRKTWSNYKNHKVSLVTASLTMNAAMELAEQINRDISAYFSDLSNHTIIMDFLNMGGIMQNNIANLDETGFMSINDGIPQTITPKALGCFHTYQLIQVYISKYYTSERVQKLLKGFYPLYLRPLLEQVIPFPQTPDEKALAKVITQVILTQQLRPHNKLGYMHDKIFHAIDSVGPRSQIPPWTVFNLQLFIDTRRMLEEDLTRGYREWDEVSREVIRALDDCISIAPDENGVIDPCYRSLLAPLKSEIQKRAPHDEYGVLMDEHFGKNKFIREDHQLMKSHPMHAGLQLTDFLEKLHANATLLYDKQPVVMMVAHLYAAAHHSGLLPQDVRWKELESVLTKQGQAHEYRFTIPPDAHDWVKHFLVASGCDKKALTMVDSRGESVLEALARNPKKPKPCNHMVRAVDAVWPVANGYKRTGASKDFGEKLEGIVAKYLQSSCNKTRGDDASAQERLPLAPQDTLAAFTKAVHDDDIILHFDALAFHRECLELLRRIQKRIANDHPLYTPLAGDAALGKVVGLMLHLRATTSDPKDPSVGFAEACRILQEHIAERGGKLLHAAYLRSGVRASCDNADFGKPKWSEDICRAEDFIDMQAREGFVSGLLRWDGWTVEQDSEGNINWKVDEGINSGASETFDEEETEEESEEGAEQEPEEE